MARKRIGSSPGPRSGKWLIEEHADSTARLGVRIGDSEVNGENVWPTPR
jgi:hypothetical protein